MNLESTGPQKASWCIFSGASDFSKRSFDPVACSSRTFTFEEVDTHFISAIRNWLKTYIRETGSLSYQKIVKLVDRNRDLALEKDLVVHVAHKVKNTNDTLSFFVEDDTDACELVTYNIFNYINAGDIIRIRSFKTHQK